MLLLVDNYDSFTYNLAQAFGSLGASLLVRRNDRLTLEEVAAMAPDRIVISPGPGRPEGAGLSIAIIRRFGASIPVLGVCLGHQAIGVAFGAEVVRLPEPVHGKASAVVSDRRGVFRDLPERIEVGRYHSLAVDDAPWPDELEVSARTMDGRCIMAVRHRRWPVEGVQFHPESVLTPEGSRLLRNFLEGPGE